MTLRKIEYSRLEILFDEEKKDLVIQGDQKGLLWLIEDLKYLAESDAKTGRHIDYDLMQFQRFDINSLVLQRVNGREQGSHYIPPKN